MSVGSAHEQADMNAISGLDGVLGLRILARAAARDLAHVISVECNQLDHRTQVYRAR